LALSSVKRYKIKTNIFLHKRRRFEKFARCVLIEEFIFYDVSKFH